MTKTCECGCGTLVSQRFARGHNQRGPLSHWWTGGRTDHQRGYLLVKDRAHGRAGTKGYVFEHIKIAELAIGRPLPPGAEVHHVNENTSDNANRNLVICENGAYHKLLHRRTKALRMTGSVHGARCLFCKQWGVPERDNMNVTWRPTQSLRAYHRPCSTIFSIKKNEKRQAMEVAP